MSWQHVILMSLMIASLSEASNKIIIVSMSGLRYDYVDKPELPTFRKFKAEGFQAKQLEIPFITNSWPSLWTISTGLWPEEHGVLDDSMYDPTIGVPFHAGVDNVDTAWMPAKPIWISAEEDNVKTAVSGWPGSDIRHGSFQASHYHRFVASESDDDTKRRIEDLSSWMFEDADLGLISFPEPDNTGHVHGADSSQVFDALERNDALLSHLLANLESFGIADQTNIIVVGDHGMTDHMSNKVIYLSDFGVRLGDLRWVTSNLFTSGMLSPHPEKINEVYLRLTQPNATVHMRTYRKADLPERFHIKNHRRTAPITLIPEKGFRIEITRPHADIQFNSRLLGMHGYDNSAAEMKPAMLARGLDFKHSQTNTFHSHEIYPMVCSLLKLTTCHGTDGTLDNPQKIVNGDLKDLRPRKLNYLAMNTGSTRKVKKSPSRSGSTSHYQYSAIVFTMSLLSFARLL